jgi:hypothetical protein
MLKLHPNKNKGSVKLFENPMIPDIDVKTVNIFHPNISSV